MKNGFQYMTRFPGNVFRSRKEFKETGEEYKLSDILSKAHGKTAETIDFEKETVTIDSDANKYVKMYLSYIFRREIWKEFGHVS